RPQRVLREWASARSVSVLDMLPGFREYRRAHPDELLYHHPDAHLNVNGHRLAGALLLEYLRRDPGFADATAMRIITYAMTKKLSAAWLAKLHARKYR